MIVTVMLMGVTAFADVTGNGKKDAPYLVGTYDELKEAVKKAVI